MQLIQLSATNFLSFEETQVIALAEQGLVLIEGENLDDPSARSNGSGKTAIIDALFWCLFETTTHDKPPVGDEVINEHVGSNCLVEVLFTHQGMEYCLRRGRRCSAPFKRLLGRATGMSLIREDGEDLTQGSTKATQAKFESLVGLSRTTFRNAVLFGQSRAYRFTSLSDTDKKQVFDEMTGVEQYAEAGERAKRALAANTEAMSMANSRLQHASELCDATNDHILSLVYAAGRWESERDERIQELEEELRQQLEEHDAYVERTSASEEAARKLRANKTARQAVVTRLGELEYLQRQKTAKLTRIDEQIDAVKEAIVIAQDQEGTCETCGQSVSETHVKNHTKLLHARIRELEKRFDACTEECNDATEAVNQRKEERDRYDTIIEALTREVGKGHDKAALSRITARGLRIRKQLDAVRAEESPGGSELLSQRMKLTLHTATVEWETALLERLSARHSVLEFWVEAFGRTGIRSLLLDNVLPYLNSRLEVYANALTDGAMELEFQTEKTLKSGETRDEFTLSMTNKHGSNLYKLNSFGQRAKADLCVGLALQDLAAQKSPQRLNVAFFDEPFESLDDIAMDRVIDLLTNELAERESVFVITHQDALKAFISKTVTVVYEEKASVIRV